MLRIAGQTAGPIVQTFFVDSGVAGGCLRLKKSIKKIHSIYNKTRHSYIELNVLRVQA